MPHVAITGTLRIACTRESLSRMSASGLESMGLPESLLITIDRDVVFTCVEQFRHLLPAILNADRGRGLQYKELCMADGSKKIYRSEEIQSSAP